MGAGKIWGVLGLGTQGEAMRKVGHDRRLPIVVPTPPEQPQILACLTCDNGYRWVARELAVFTGSLYWKKRRAAEALHGHWFISDYPAFTRLRWEEHCERCHGIGEVL
jgi:hypothetical protein